MPLSVMYISGSEVSRKNTCLGEGTNFMPCVSRNRVTERLQNFSNSDVQVNSNYQATLKIDERIGVCFQE